MSESLPKGWAETTLGELLPISYGKALSASARRSGSVPVYGSSGVVGTHTHALTTGATIIVGRKGNVGSTHLSPVPCWPIDTVYFHDAGKKDVRFQAYLLRSLQLDRLDRSTTIPGLSRDDYNVVRIALPPEGEQIRIVEALESYLSRLDSAVDSLVAARRKLKAYRASVLKAAVEGRLVPTEAELARKKGRSYEPADALLERILRERRRRWEAAELEKMKAAGKTPEDDRWKKRYPQPDQVDNASLPSLPEGWCWATVDQIGDVLLGRQRAPQFLTGEWSRPYLRVANIKDDRIDFDDLEEMDFGPEHFEKYRLQAGDILVSEGQSPHLVGQSATYRGGVEGLCFQKTLHRFRPFSPGPSSEFAQTVFRAHVSLGVFKAVASITTNIAHLTLEKFKRSRFPLPPAREQESIVEEVARQMSVADAAERQVVANRRRLKRLRQSVLTWAFTGRLVDQSPTDEPAGTLLATIRAVREATPVATPRTRRSRKLKAAS
jgi:type I restriction enzyme S subunit